MNGNLIYYSARKFYSNSNLSDIVRARELVDIQLHNSNRANNRDLEMKFNALTDLMDEKLGLKPTGAKQ